MGWCTRRRDIGQVTVYLMSTENLRRSKRQLSTLWDIYRDKFRELARNSTVMDNGIKVRILGDSSLWRPDVLEAARLVMDSTKSYTKYLLNIMVAYSSRFETFNAIRKCIQKRVMPPNLKGHLLVNDNVDLIVRTGKLQRLSNFLLLQSAYANIYFEPKLWPSTTAGDFEKWMDFYALQENKYGR